MRINESLFLSENICLGPIDHEKDSIVESRWSHELDFTRISSLKPGVPLSAAQIKKDYEKIEISEEEANSLFHFSIRLNRDDHLIGIAEINGINWANTAGGIFVGIGEREARGKGYGSEAVRLMLRFAFNELNLYRLSVEIPEYNFAGRKIVEKFRFSEEVYRRLALERDGRYWNLYHYGLLRSEYLGLPPLANGDNRE